MSKRFVQLLELKSDPELIDFYEKAHQADNIWTEIVEGIKKVGIQNMEIYRKDTHLVMIIDAPDDFDFKASMDQLSTLERQQEWEEYVGRAQACDSNATSSGKWQLTKKIFSLNRCFPCNLQ